MSVRLAVSDALNRRLKRFDAARYAAFQLAAVDVVKGRAGGEHVFTSGLNQRNFYALKRGEYTLYYSRDDRLPPALQAQSLVFEEFFTEDDGELLMDLFAGWPEKQPGAD